MRLKVISNRLHQGFRLWPALHHKTGGKQRHAASGQLNPPHWPGWRARCHRGVITRAIGPDLGTAVVVTKNLAEISTLQCQAVRSPLAHANTVAETSPRASSTGAVAGAMTRAGAEMRSSGSGGGAGGGVGDPASEGCARERDGNGEGDTLRPLAESRQSPISCGAGSALSGPARRSRPSLAPAPWSIENCTMVP